MQTLIMPEYPYITSASQPFTLSQHSWLQDLFLFASHYSKIAVGLLFASDCRQIEGVPVFERYTQTHRWTWSVHIWHHFTPRWVDNTRETGFCLRAPSMSTRVNKTSFFVRERDLLQTDLKDQSFSLLLSIDHKYRRTHTLVSYTWMLSKET